MHALASGALAADGGALECSRELDGGSLVLCVNPVPMGPIRFSLFAARSGGSIMAKKSKAKKKSTKKKAAPARKKKKTVKSAAKKPAKKAAKKATTQAAARPRSGSGAGAHLAPDRPS